MTKVLKTILYIICCTLVFVIATIMQAFTFQFLWNWFMVPVNFVPIAFFQAMGLSLFFDFVTYHYYDYKNKIEVIPALMYIFARPLAALTIGALIQYLRLTFE